VLTSLGSAALSAADSLQPDFGPEDQPDLPDLAAGQREDCPLPVGAVIVRIAPPVASSCMPS